jgi:hypothetical protein
VRRSPGLASAGANSSGTAASSSSTSLCSTLPSDPRSPARKSSANHDTANVARGRRPATQATAAATPTTCTTTITATGGIDDSHSTTNAGTNSASGWSARAAYGPSATRRPTSSASATRTHPRAWAEPGAR